MTTYLHERLTRTLLKEMASGSWRDGQSFLSIREIIRRWRVSQPTVLSSLRSLQEKGLLTPSARRGLFLQRDFQQKAQILLRRSRTPAIPPQLHLEQKARMLKGVRGGKVALLLESKVASPLQEYAGLDARMSPSPRACAEAFLRESRKHDFTVHSFLYDGSRRVGAWIRRRLEEGGFEGAAVFCRSSHRIIKPTLEPLMERHLPIVIMYDDCQGLPVHSINLNNVGLGYDAIRQLYKLGHRKITIVARRTLLKLHKARIKGCLLAQTEGGCEEARLTVLRINGAAPLPPQVRRHFANPATRPTAVFACESDQVAHLAPFWKEIGLSIPEDISLIACSSKTALPMIDVPLDTMHLRMGARIGRTAARQLRLIQAGEPLEKSVLLDVKYVRRGSTRPLETR